MCEQITLRLDRVTRAALRVLTSDSTTTEDAVRAAVTYAAERYPARPTPPLLTDQEVEAWVTHQVVAAPPLTEYQTYMLTTVFKEGSEVWLTEEHWSTLRETP